MGTVARRIPVLLVLGALTLAWIAATAPAGRAARSRHPKVAVCRSHGRVVKGRRRATKCRPAHHTTARPKAPAPAAPAHPVLAPAPQTPTTPAGASTPPPAPAPEKSETPPLTPPPTSIPHVEVTAVEYSFTLSRSTVPAGKVVFEFVNNGQDEHNLNIASGAGELAGSFGNALASTVHEQTVEMRAGTYTLFCSLPEHEKRGMKATLTVE